jgi:hypothetical protein
MRFMVTVKSVENAFGPPPPALFAAIAALGQEAAQAGVLVETGGLLPTSEGAVVRVGGGGGGGGDGGSDGGSEMVVLDGPFSETKEVIGGYAVYELASKAEAIAWTKRFMAVHQLHWPQWRGESEIRQIMTFPAPRA